MRNTQTALKVPIMERRGTRTAIALPQNAFAPIEYRGGAGVPIGRDWLLRLTDVSVNPLAIVLSLFIAALVAHAKVSSNDVLLAIVVLSLTYRGHFHLTRTIAGVARHVIAGWLTVSGLLLFFGWLTGAFVYFNQTLLVTWWCVAPACQFSAQLLLRYSKPAIVRLQGKPARAVVVGVNEQGMELARRMGEPATNLHMVGFFDDRPDEHLNSQHRYPMLGKLRDLPRFANENNINVIYISLPMAHQPRIQALLDGLHDTTASIYFVPDLFVTDLIQGRVDSVHGLPVVAVCETPFTGLNGVIKRISDIALSMIFLVLLSPLLLLIALSVKLNSRGPVIFRQRRYGLDGREIVVYKFRTMRVTEDGDIIRQASKHDPRVTRFGAFLRRTSMDELPQFFNVLLGHMSIVGPRPHAVAHNEMYRKLIKGYTLRHKVRPGITGWAQVNGLRGKTETVHEMQERVSYDLDYLRNWSLGLDCYIIAKTVWVVLKGGNAY
jgi:putative colanic acid biosynthesis UDP-glucose lipid carrier transferase